MRCRTARNLASVAGMKLLTAEAGVHRHQQYEIELAQGVIEPIRAVSPD
jgi:hypothetical protein